MNVINFKDTSCAHCYKCLRHCDVKAIRIQDGQAQIVRDMCIYCGHCMEICPQKAKTLDSDLAYVKSMLQRKEEVVVSLDPSYCGLLNMDKPKKIINALLKLGFSQVRETAEGADPITEEYARLINEGKMENIITTSCPAINYLVEKHYPMLIPYLAPIVSPMIAHGRMIKKMMGKDTKVVFIGPCVAKKMEAEADPVTMGAVDAVIEFNELETWLEEEGINPEQLEEGEFANPDSMVNQLYAVPTGILRAVQMYGANGHYKCMTVSSIKSARELLHSMKRGYLKDCFIELNLCAGVCVNGPGVNKRRGFRFKAAMNIENNVLIQKPKPNTILTRDQLTRRFTPKQVVEKMPSEAEIKEILKTIGKSNSDTEFNCGACGYMSCREKAIAIYQGKAESAMCLIRAYENTRSQANVVMDYIPSMIIIADSSYRIKEFNKQAEKVFKTSRMQALRSYLFDFIDIEEFEAVYMTHQSLYHIKKRWDYYNMVVMMTIVYIENSDRVLAIIDDITEDERRVEKMMDRKLRTIRMAQDVIDKQMATAQEIAGLLGETTAETKVTLNQLRDYLMDDEGI